MSYQNDKNQTDKVPCAREDSGKSKGYKQYGKKGSRPRTKELRSSTDLDSITTNRIEYWNKNADFINVTKFNWDLIVGSQYNLNGAFDLRVIKGTGSSVPTVSDTSFSAPAVMTIDLVMGPGYAASTNDGVNRSLARTMAKIRAALSTSTIGFETADLGIYMASTASIATAIAIAKRALESVTVWQQRNYATPRALLKSMGFLYEDVAYNINAYAGKLNAIIDRYNGMYIPDFSDIYDRQYVMCHNVYADEDSELAQYYVFRPVNYYTYDDKTSKAISNNYTWSFQSAGGFDGFLDIITSMLDSWYTSSDLYQINGTLLRAFKEIPTQSIPHYELHSVLMPVVDREHLMQIMNLTIVPVDTSPGKLDITQDPTTQNYVIWKPQLTTVTDGAPTVRSKHLLRIFENDPTPEDNMELTRLLTLWSQGSSGEDKDDIVNCGSELVTHITCYVYSASDDSMQPFDFLSNTLVIDATGSGSDLSHTINCIGAISPFRYVPCFYLIAKTTAGTADFAGILGDQYNYMLYDMEDWKRLQFVAYESMWTPKLV